jgi:hypothetical protein
MKIAIAQMTSKADPEGNFKVCEQMARQAAKNGAEMVFWPESTDIIFDEDYPKEEERKDYDGSRLKVFVDKMAGLAKEVRRFVSTGFDTRSLLHARKLTLLSHRPNSTYLSAPTRHLKKNPKNGTCPTSP